MRLRVRGTAGDLVVVRHAEVLNPDGSLHTLALRAARATDEYLLDGSGDEVLEPAFTFHGFRHVDIETTADGAERRGPGHQLRSAGPILVRLLGSRAQPTPRERGLVRARQLRVAADRLPAARRAPRLDRRRAGVRRHGLDRCSTRMPSGRAGCATSSWTRTTRSACPASCPMSSSRGPRGSGGRGGRTPRPSSRGLSTSPTATRTSSSASSTACAAGCARSSHGSSRRASSSPGCSSVTGSTRTHHRSARGSSKADSEFIANAFFAHSARLLARTAAIVGDEATERVGRRARRPRRDARPGRRGATRPRARRRAARC